MTSNGTIMKKASNNWWRATLLGLAFFLSLAAMVLLVLDRVVQPTSFPLQRLKIVGTFKYLQPHAIEEAVGSLRQLGFFTIDLGNVRQQVEAIDWVASARARRKWPDTLIVEVEEHVPVMRWNSNKLVNSYGEVVNLTFPQSEKETIDLVGAESDSVAMMRHALEWQQALASHGMLLQRLALSRSNAWKLKLRHISSESEFEVLLGQHQLDARMQRFLTLFEHRLGQLQDVELSLVDARYPNGVAIRLRDSDALHPITAVERVAAL